MFTFDGPNRLMIADLGVTEFNVTADLYAEWKRWVVDPAAVPPNGVYPNAFRTVGGDAINASGSSRIPPFHFLQNGWRVRPQEADHTLTIEGNLLTEDGTSPLAPTLGGWDIFTQTILSVNSVETVITQVVPAGLTPEAVAAITAPLIAEINANRARLDQMWTGDEIITPTTYQRRDRLTGEVLVNKIHTDDGAGGETLVDP